MIAAGVSETLLSQFDIITVVTVQQKNERGRIGGTRETRNLNRKRTEPTRKAVTVQPPWLASLNLKTDTLHSVCLAF